MVGLFVSLLAVILDRKKGSGLIFECCLRIVAGSPNHSSVQLLALRAGMWQIKIDEAFSIAGRSQSRARSHSLRLGSFGRPRPRTPCARIVTRGLV